MIRYLNGDALDPQLQRPDERAFIAHICNDQGAWGAGFVMALSLRWPSTGFHYLRWFRGLAWRGSTGPFALGEIQFVGVARTTWVVNMIAQHEFPTSLHPVAVDFAALRRCLLQLTERVEEHDGVGAVHMPRIGCGIAGATWDQIEPLIAGTLCAANIPVTVYDLPALEVA